MTEIRVVLAHMPRLLREIVRTTLDAEHDIRVVAELTDAAADLPSVLAADPVDVIVGGTESPALAALVTLRPAVRLVLIAADGREGYVCRPTGEMPPEALVEAVRGSTATHPPAPS